MGRDDIRPEEDLLQALLASDALPEGADDEARELFVFVQACREATRVPVDDEAVVARSLAVSTREDLSWRGDARDLSRFVRDRLRSSAVLRLAAASLLLHLAALPVVALYMLTEDPAVPEFRVEVAQRRAPFDPQQKDEPEQELEITDPTGADELLVENTLRWSRYQLGASRSMSRASEFEPPSWLSDRFGVLYGERKVGAGDFPDSLPEAFARIELALDRHLVGPRRTPFSPELREVLDEVAATLDVTEQSSAWLMASTLARAESYGLRTNSSTRALELARAELPLNDPRRPLIEVIGDVRALMPVDSLWLDALRQHDPGCVSASLIDLVRAVEPGRLR